MNNPPTPTSDKKKMEKDWNALFDEYRETQKAAVLCLRLLTYPRREEVLEIRSAAEAARRPTDNKMITREYTGNYRNDNDEENDDNNGDSVDEGEGG